MKPLQTPEEIFRIAFGYMASKALFSGVDLGIFDALADGPKPFEALVNETGAEAPGLRTLLTALVAIGLLELSDPGYSNAPATQLMLVRTPEGGGGFADYCLRQVDRQMYPFLHNVAYALRGQRDAVPFVDYEAWFGDAAEAALYSESQHSASLGTAVLLAQVVDLSDRRCLLDVGGGTGAFSITLCGLYPELSATVIDFPNVTRVGRRLVAEAGLSERIDFLDGNALAIDWPTQQDVVLFSYVSGSVSAPAVGELYRRAHAALEPGGRVLIHDFMVDDERRGPLLPALWAFQHAAFTPGAAGLTPGFVEDRLRKAGFEGVSFESLVPGMTRIATARRPT